MQMRNCSVLVKVQYITVSNAGGDSWTLSLVVSFLMRPWELCRYLKRWNPMLIHFILGESL